MAAPIFSTSTGAAQSAAPVLGLLGQAKISLDEDGRDKNLTSKPDIQKRSFLTTGFCLPDFNGLTRTKTRDKTLMVLGGLCP